MGATVGDEGGHGHFRTNGSDSCVRHDEAAPAVARASGGGARSELWLQICASVLGLPIERVAVDDGSAYGAALLGAVAGGLFASVEDAVTATVRVTGTIDPDPAWQERYQSIYPRFRALYPALHPQ